jgi:hypothetical protein
MNHVKRYFFFCFLLISNFSISQYTGQRVVGSSYEFEEGSTERLYGDRVVLRDKPSSTATAMDTLSIGSEVQIVQKTEEKSSLNGLDWNWYKVKVGRKTGYILGGLIALDHIAYSEDVVYLVTIAGTNRTTEDWEYIDYKVRARALAPTGEFYGHESKLNTSSFYIEAFGNRGVEGIDEILVINLFAEACGVDGGEIYVFNDGSRLMEAFQLTKLFDGGSFWFTEKVMFPDDDKNWGNGTIIYTREQGETMNEELGWTKATINTLELKWESDHSTPNIEEFEFGEGE